MSLTRAVTAVLVVIGFTGVAAADPPATNVEELTARARELASHGSCDAAAHLGRQVRAVDESYYNAVFLSDRVIIGCDAPSRPSITSPQPPEAAAELPDRHGLTYYAEVGTGYGGFTGLSGGTQSYNVGAGIGRFVSPHLVIGLRGVIVTGGPTNLTYTPPPPAGSGFGVPGGSPETHRGDPASQLVVVELQRWSSDEALFYGLGFGIGHGHLSPEMSDIGPATSGVAFSARAGVAMPFGLELSCELTGVAGAAGQINFAVLVGWQRF